MTSLEPGLAAVAAARGRVHRALQQGRAHWQSAQRLAEAERQLDRLRRENAALAAERDTMRAQLRAAAAVENGGARLLRAETVSARVLGPQGRACLVRNHLIDAGEGEGVLPGALVLDEPMIDAGSGAGIEPGNLVVAGRRVVGKIDEAGAHTSTVRAMTEPGYRDLVRIGGPTGPQGILEGTGHRLARVRLVEVTWPVAEGDPVYSSAGEGVLEAPPLCGHVARLDRPVGAAHWEILVEPAAAGDCPERVAVVKTDVNVERVGARERGNGEMMK